MRVLKYSLDEALVSLWRGRRSAVLSMGTITLASLVLGGLLLITRNLERLAAEWGNAAELSVYLSDEIAPAERRAVELALDGDPIAAGHEFVSKADALRRFKQTFADLTGAIETVGDNPLPASIEVRLRSGATAADVDRLGTKLRRAAGVDDVRYDHEWLARVLSAIHFVRNGGIVLAAILTFAAGLTVASVVRLSLFGRRDEIDIMQLVGAPHMYIRGPFVVEGVLQGGIGAAVAVGTLGALFFALRRAYLTPLGAAIGLSSIQFLSVELSAALILGGMAVGCFAGMVAAARA